MKEIEKLSHAFALTRGHPGKAGETLKDSHGPCVDYIRAKDGFEAGFHKAREMAIFVFANEGLTPDAFQLLQYLGDNEIE